MSNITFNVINQSINFGLKTFNLLGDKKISSAPKPATPQYVKNGLVFMLDCKSLTAVYNRWASESGLKCEPFSFEYRDRNDNRINFIQKDDGGVSIDYPNETEYKYVTSYNDEFPKVDWSNGFVIELCVKLKSISNLAKTKSIDFGIFGNGHDVSLRTYYYSKEQANHIVLDGFGDIITRKDITFNDTDIYTITASSCGNVWINGQAVGDKFTPYAKKDVASVPHGTDGSLYLEGNAVIYSARIYGNDVVFGDAQALNNYNADQARYGVKEFTLDESVLDGNDWLG